MIDRLLDIFIQITLTVLVIRFYLSAKQPKNAPKADWKDASATLEKIEQRVAVLHERDIKNQEKIWNLEDENRMLKHLVAELKRAIPKED